MIWCLLASLFLGFRTDPAQASVYDGGLCDRAASVAAQAYGVPLSVMRAITRTETGRTKDGALHPWPWTVNMEGKGAWFDTEAEAHRFAARHLKRGAESFDVGCFQINYRWHGQAFASLDDMFDPSQNAAYAAGFLKRLYAEFGSWDEAAGAYHSRTPKFANRYISRFRTIRAALDDRPLQTDAPKIAQVAPRENTYPLIKRTQRSGRLGSLVPLGRGTATFLPRVGG